MVRLEMKGTKAYHICDICNLAYEDKDWAKACQKWCSTSKSCNLEITKHAVKQL